MEEMSYVFSSTFFSLPLIFTLVAASISHFVTAATTISLKLSLVISYTDFHPVYDLKGDRALGNSFKLMPKQTNSNKVLLHVQSETGNLYQIVSLKSS